MLAYPHYGRAQSVYVAPARNSSSLPFDAQLIDKPAQWRYATGWNPNSDRNDNKYDYGMIWLNNSFSNTGWFRFLSLTNQTIASYEGSQCSWPNPSDAGAPDVRGDCRWFVVGYPQEHPGTMWYETGTVQNRNLAYTLRYRMRTTEGESGGPVFGFSGQQDAVPVVIGIHTSWDGEGIARRIEAELEADLRAWASESAVA